MAIKLNPLSEEEKAVIIDKQTEPPFSGKYDSFFQKGVYVCRRCDTPLYNSDSKFDAHCGWPSFDDAMPGAIIRIPDTDGLRTEIVCSHCSAHLGHVFEGDHGGFPGFGGWPHDLTALSIAQAERIVKGRETNPWNHWN